MMKRLKYILAVGFIVLASTFLTSLKVQAPPPQENLTLSLEDQIKNEFPFAIEKDATLSTELVGQGFTPKDVQDILMLSKPHYNLSILPLGMRYRLIYANNPVVSRGGIEFKLSPTKTLRFAKDLAGVWQVEKFEEKVETRIVSFAGSVRNSLWESARQANMSPSLIAQLTDIFGWELDFSRQVTENDYWRLTVEQHIVRGRVVGYGRILAAEYNNNSKSYNAIYFERQGQISGYFDTEGRSLSKSFLRSPIEFARISSGFSLRRFHPKLKIFRPHLGVDYAAPTGTPIRALGDGVVLEAKYTTGGGKTVSLSHGGTFKTRYLHMSAFAARVRAGTPVKQGQVIGYVGSTGLSTGPHLHFEFYKNNHYVDPLKVDLPANIRIPMALMTDFKAVSSKRLAQLPPRPTTVASAAF